MSQIIKVMSAALTENSAVLYDIEGEPHIIPAGDPRIPQMVEKVFAAVAAKNIPVLVDISTFSVFAEIEKESKGFMRFFRVAKKGLGMLLGKAADRGPVNPGGFVTTPEPGVKEQPGTPPITPQVKKDLEKAQKEANQKKLPDSETTIVAVVGDTPIVGAEKLTKQIQASVIQGNTLPAQNMLKRLAAVAAKRKHTAQEAMVFLEKMDLPPCMDGSILAYKSLTKTSEEGVFKDNHSGKLKQGLGTFVMMDVELVDDNRRVLCSNGLHVAQRGYLGGYGTHGNNVVTLIKIAPEDVISVPMNETQKMRVRAYHIVAVLTEADLYTIRNQKSITASNDFNSSLLGKIVNGDHVGILNVTHERGKNNVEQMTPWDNVSSVVKNSLEEYLNPNVDQEEIKKSKPITEAKTLETVQQETKVTEQVDVAALNQKIKEAGIDKAPEPEKDHAADHSEAYILYQLWLTHRTVAAWDALMKHKKDNPFKSWKTLGLTEEQASEIGKESSRKKPKKSDVKLARKTEKANQKNQKKKETKPVTKSIFSEGINKPKEAVVKKAPGAPNKVRQAFDFWKQSKTDEAFEVLMVAKKQAKKGWTAFGFTSIEIAEIEAKLKK